MRSFSRSIPWSLLREAFEVPDSAITVIVTNPEGMSMRFNPNCKFRVSICRLNGLLDCVHGSNRARCESYIENPGVFFGLPLCTVHLLTLAGRPCECVFTPQREADVFRVRITGRLQSKEGHSAKWIGEESDSQPGSGNDTDEPSDNNS